MRKHYANVIPCKYLAPFSCRVIKKLTSPTNSQCVCNRIIFGRIRNEIVAELIDTEGYRLWVEKVTHQYQWARVLVSNGISIPIDSLIFVWIAFGGVLPAAVVWSIFVSNVIIKGITTLISIPGIYLVRERKFGE